MNKDPQHVIEDELLKLWQRVPLEPADLEAVAPTLVSRLSRTGQAGEAWAALNLLLLDAQDASREAASVAAALGVGVHADESIDQRLADAASQFDKESSRTGRRWARRGVEWLAALIIEDLADLDSMSLRLVQVSQDSFRLSFWYDSDDAIEPLSYLGVVVNGTPLALSWTEDEEGDTIIQLNGAEAGLDKDGIFQVDVSWIGLGDLDAQVFTELHAGFGQNTSIRPRSVSVTVASGAKRRAPAASEQP